MIQSIWESAKNFFTFITFPTEPEEYLLYLVVIGIGIISILTIKIIVKLNRDIKRLNKEKRKADKSLLKFISNKKNKTY